jgi:hypothetical protein
MTSYTIEVGYNSTHDRADVGRKILAVIADLQANPEKIGTEVLRIEPDRDAERLKDFTEMYRAPIQDLTLKVTEDSERENLPVVRQSASAGGESRDYKEACRRAVCRLVLDACHRERMEVSITVS